MIKTACWLCVVISSLLCTSVFAEQKPSLITIGEGFWDVQRSKRRTAEFFVEYRSSLEWYYFRPIIGLVGNNKGGFYTYGGFVIDGVIADCFVISPSLAVGLYQRGNGKKLGLPMEFREGIEMAWQFKNKVRLGAMFYHMSNASMGSRNPGTESLVFLLSVPLDFTTAHSGADRIESQTLDSPSCKK